MLDPLQRLAAANPEPRCDPPPIEDLWRRIETGAGLERIGARSSARGANRAARRGHRAGSLLIGGSTIVVVAIVAAAIGLLSHNSSPSTPTSPGASALIAKLAVLRRPQRAVDRLPAHIHVVPSSGTIIPSLTRLVHESGGTRLYVVGVTPARHDALWSPRDGDQVAVVAVYGHWGDESVPTPAVGLSNADEVQNLNPRTTGRPWIRVSAVRKLRGYSYAVAVVPDGVARVRWTTLAGDSLADRKVVETAAHDNVASVKGGTGLLVRGSWYGSSGAVIPTSDKALLAARRARQAPQIAETIRYDERHSPTPSAAVLADFAVFAVTSTTGVHMANGDIVSHPPLAKLPWSILQGGLADPPGGGPSQAAAILGGPDPLDIRQVITPSGSRLYVIPTHSGLCLESLDKSPLADGLLGGGGGGTCGPLARVESQGLGFSGGSFGTTTAYRIVPKTIHSIVVLGANGVRRRVAVPDGIYVSRSTVSRR